MTTIKKDINKKTFPNSPSYASDLPEQQVEKMGYHTRSGANVKSSPPMTYNPKTKEWTKRTGEDKGIKFN